MPIRHCQNLQEVRAEIDRLDQQILPLLLERLCYIRQAAGFKPTRQAVVVPERIEEIVATVKAVTRQAEGPNDIVENIYRDLIAHSIAYEDRCWLALHAASDLKSGQ